MDEYRTAKGEIVHVGDLFRDRKRTAIRTLRVDRLEVDHLRTLAPCTIVREEFEGNIATTNRTTSMNAETLTGRSFERVEEA